MARRRGLSARWKLTLSYAGFLLAAGVLLLGAVWLFLLRYVPEGPVTTPGPFVPDRGDLLRAFAPAAAVVLSALLVLGLLGGWLLAGRMLAPLARIADATRAASGGSLAHRIRMPGPEDEFRELADAFDGMLERLEAHVAEQQRFAANASHELRTPLAITRTLLEVARADPGRDQEELLDRLQVVNQRAIDLTEALLVLSRADQRAFDREGVDVSLLAEEAAETLHPVAEVHGVAVSVEGDAAVALGSAALLQQLTTNLVQNAVLHNSGAGGWVRVVTSAMPSRAGLPGAAVLSVENTGEQLAPALIATLTEPFQRGTARVRSTHGAGVGLGLAIVQRIADAHGGTLELAAREGGGLRATVTLPAAPRP